MADDALIHATDLIVVEDANADPAGDHHLWDSKITPFGSLVTLSYTFMDSTYGLPLYERYDWRNLDTTTAYEISTDSVSLTGSGGATVTEKEMIAEILADSGTEPDRVSFSDVINLHFGPASTISGPTTQMSTLASGVGDIFIANADRDSGVSSDTIGATQRYHDEATSGGDKAGVLFDYEQFNSSFSNDHGINELLPGAAGYFDFMHELLHTLNLVDAAAAIGLPFDFDNQKYTILTGANISPDVHALPYTLQLMDIAALQADFHSRNYLTRAEDTAYLLSPMIGRETFQTGFLSTTSTFMYTVWDGDGVDVMDANYYRTSGIPVELDLRQGHFSSVGIKDALGTPVPFDNDPLVDHASDPDPGNIAIAYYTVIENAIGTMSDDHLIGNAWDNALYGDDGDDNIYGDGASYDADPGFHDSDSYRPGPDAASDNSGNDVLIGGAGNDTLFGGKGDDILQGGWARAELDAMRPGWDTAAQFPRTVPIPHTDDGSDTADYSRLYLSDASGTQSVPTGSGISVTFSTIFNSTTGHSEPIFVVQKGTLDGSGVGSDGTDKLISVETIIGTGGNDHFYGSDGNVTGDISQAMSFQGGAGDDTYSYSNRSDLGAVRIDDSSGSDTLVLQGVDYFAFSTVVSPDNGDLYADFALSNILPTRLWSHIFLDITQNNVEFLVFNDPITFNLKDVLDFLVAGGPGIYDPSTLAANLPSITSGGSDPNLFGGPGNDTLDSGTGGPHTMAGADGDDTYIIRDSGDVVNENPGEGTDTAIAYVDWTLAPNVEKLLLADASALIGTGNDGDNELTGNGVGSTLLGGLGNDTYDMDNTSDVISENGGEGTDLVQSSITFSLGSIANVEDLTLTGTGNVNGTGNSAANVITGNSGNNSLDGASGADALIGGDGNDTYAVDNSGDTVTENGGEGTDLVISSVSYTLSSEVENLTLTGSSNIDATGNSSDNILTSNSGVDTLTGGDGNDTYVINNPSDHVVENPGEGTADTIQIGSTLDLNSNAMYANIENLTLTGSSNINATGTTADNVLTSNSGVDTLTGGTGNDTYVINNASDVVVENSGEGTADTIQIGSTLDLSSNGMYANIENLTLTGSSNINGAGTSGANILTGNSGNNSLDGAAGADVMIGGGGNDTYFVDNAGDVVSEDGSPGVDVVISSVTHSLTANVENLTLTGSTSIDGTGNGLDNIITSNTGVDTLTGGDGNDTYVVNNASDVIVEGSGAGSGTDTIQTGMTYSLASISNVENLTLTGSSNYNGTGNSLDNVITSNTGVDTLTGQTGNDTYVVNNASDKIIENSAEGTDLVLASVAYTLDSNVENLTFTGSSALTGFGNTSANVLTANNAGDSLRGQGGNDTLIGGTGNDYMGGDSGADTMSGGAGDDTYDVDNTGDVVIESAGGGHEKVGIIVSYALPTYVEDLTVGGSGGVVGTGNDLDNGLASASANNTLVGLGGNDTLTDGGTGDTLIGGTGDDFYWITTGHTAVVVESASEGTDTVRVSADYTLGSNVEDLLFDLPNHVGTGNSLDNSMSSVGGVCTLYGLGGNDTLTGSLDADTLIGGTGDDTYTVDNSSDVVSENGSEGRDIVFSSIDYTLGSNVEDLTLTGTSSLLGIGNSDDNVINGNVSGDHTLSGAGGADTIFGNGGNDSILGGTGNDTLDGGTGNDVMLGGTGDDTFVVDSSSDTLTENVSEGTDTVQSSVTWTLASNFENLTLTGSSNINGSGNSLDNVLTANSGVDTLTGGTGNDTYVVSSSSNDHLVENASEGTDLVQSSVSWTLATNFENLTLSGSSNIDGTGNSVANTIIGNGGDNTLDGGSGADSMLGGGGNDTFIVDNTGDVVTENSNEGTADAVVVSVSYTLPTNVEILIVDPGASNLAIVGNSAANVFMDPGSNLTFSGGAGDDTYYVDDASNVLVENSSEGTDTVVSNITWTLGSNLEDLILTGSANINGIGNSLNNVISSNTGIDTLTGGTGDDTYVVNNASDVVVENSSEGTDLLQSSVSVTLAANVENLTLIGASDINGTGNSVVNIVTGNSGNNTLDGGSGADTMAGAAGNDVYIIDDASDVVTENADEGIDTVKSSLTWTLGSNVENLTLTGSSNIDGTGNSLDNVLTSNSGVNTLTGGAGNDIYVVSNTSDVVVEGSSAGTDTVQSSVTWTLGSNFENLTLTGSSNINGTGNAVANIIISNSGVDTLTGGAGNDTYVVNNASDVVVENSSEGADFVQSSVSFTLGSNLENLTLTGTSDLNATGNSLVNVITGNDGSNTIDGGSGADTMTGGAGDDTYIVDDAGDVVAESQFGGGDLVQSGVTFALGSYFENLTLTGSSNINGTGNTLDNTIVSNSGVDTLTGGDGDDIYVVNNTSDVVVESSGAGTGTDLVQSSVTFTLGSNIEDLTLTGSSNINGTGNSLDNVITSNTGVDTLTGAAGNDTYEIDNSSDVIVENSAEGTDFVESSVSFTLSSNVENLALTGSSNINGTGNSGVNVIAGNDGNNSLDGGAGADTLNGGAGDDTYVVDNAADFIVETADNGIDLVQSSITFTLAANVENLALNGSSNINGTGNDLDNILTSNSGVDTLAGSRGDDTYVVNNASDVVVENANEGTDLVQSGFTWTLDSNIENLTLTASSDINGTGNSSVNILTGNSGNNVLDGGSGADSLIGGSGNDTYIVDNASDVVTESSSAGTDTVQSSVAWTLGSNVENLTLTGSSSINGTGNSLNNVISSNSGVDTLTGGAGNDTYVVSNASDVVAESTGEGTDIVHSSVSFTLGNYVENLTLTGSSSINATGNSLDNLLTSNSGVDTLTGGAGNDTYVVSNASDVVVENSSEGTDLVQSSVTFTLGSNIENLTLTGSSNVNATGNTLDNVITGNSGDNTLSGGSGNDTYLFSNGSGHDLVIDSGGTDTIQFDASVSVASVIYSHSGNDLLIGYGTGTDTITVQNYFSGSANQIEQVLFSDSTTHDVTYVTDHANVFSGTSSDDAFGGTTSADTMSGLGGSDTMNAFGGNDTLDGGAGNDTLNGGTGADTMTGGTGDDTFVVDDGGDVVNENTGEGTDTVQSAITYTLGTYVENLTLTGSSNINGTGNGSSNIITSNSGTDTLTGGAGDDTYVVSNSSDVIVENSSEGTDLVQSSVSFTLASNVENLTLTGSSNVNATGNSGVNIVIGNSGDNSLDGGSGADTMTGGTGNDTYVVDNASDVVTENTGEGMDLVQSSIAYALGNYVENLTLTGSSSINGTGNSLDNVLTSNSGVDSLIGSTGNDTYVVSNSSDVIVENSSEGTDLVQSSVNFTLASNVENLTLTGSSNINGTGNGAVNIITGNSGNNSLDGGSGADTMNGGTGNDTYAVDNASDVITENSTEGTDLVLSSVTFTLASNVENLTLTGSSSLNGTGNGQDNIITSNAGVDTLTGGAGNDTYVVNNASDVIVENSSEGTDLIQTGMTFSLASLGNVENLTLTGSGNYNGTGNSLVNVLTGNSGDNSLDGGSGADTMIGAAGNDTYVVDNTSDVITENSSEGTDLVQSSVTFTLASNVENLTLTGSSNINGTGNSLDNVFTSNSGVNTFTGGTGNDTYAIGNASDVIVENSSEGTDLIQSSVTFALSSNVENLTLTGSSNIDGTGNTLDNTITGNSGVNTLNGSDGNDVIYGMDANDSLVGGVGNDTLDGGNGNDTMVGGTGNDIYVVDNAADAVTENASEGTDEVQAAANWTLGSNFENLTLTGSSAINGTGNTQDNTITGNSGVNTLSGSDGNDYLIGGGSNDSLTGGNGNDILDGGTGNDTMTGGAGDDTYIVDSTSDVLTESASSGTDTVQSSVTWTLGTNFEKLTLTGSSNIDGTGNSAVNVITGNSGNNSLDGGSGADTMIGGAGSDTYIVDNASDVITENSSEGTDIVLTTITYTLAANVENLTYTGGSGASNPTGTGNSLDNVMTAEQHTDTLDGQAGNDTLDDGVTANQTTLHLIGGTGDDTYYLHNSGSDSVVERSNEGTDTIISDSTYTLDANVENLTLTGSTNHNGTGNTLDNIITGNSGVNNLSGSSGNDTLYGLASNDSLDGGTGNDTLDGGTGNDTMTGGSGDDLYVVDSTSDVLTESASSGTDTVQSSVTWTLGSNFENLALTGSSAINGTGNTLDNLVTGNSGANTLSGSSGNDTLDGGDGLDTLTGGTGADIFLFHPATAFNNIDVVSDFNKTTDNDKLDVHDILIGYSGTVTDFVRISDSGSDSIVEIDRDGTGGTYGWQQIATLKSITGLTDEAALVSSGNLIVT